MAKNRSAETRKLYIGKGHAEALRKEVEATLVAAFEERWNGSNNEQPRPLVAKVESVELKFPWNRNLNKYSASMTIPYVVDYHGLYARREFCVLMELDANETAEEISEKLRGAEPELLELVRKDVSQLPDVYPEESIGSSNPAKPFVSVSLMCRRGDYHRKGEVSFYDLFGQIMRDTAAIYPTPKEMGFQYRGALKPGETMPENALSLTKMDWQIEYSDERTFSPSIRVKYVFSFQDDEHQYNLNTPVTLPDLFPIFREKNAAARAEITEIIKEQIIAGFRSAYGNLPGYILDILGIDPVVDAFRPNGVRFGNIRCYCSPAIPRNTEISFFFGGWLIGEMAGLSAEKTFFPCPH